MACSDLCCCAFILLPQIVILLIDTHDPKRMGNVLLPTLFCLIFSRFVSHPCTVHLSKRTKTKSRSEHFIYTGPTSHSGALFKREFYSWFNEVRVCLLELYSTSWVPYEFPMKIQYGRLCRTLVYLQDSAKTGSSLGSL